MRWVHIMDQGEYYERGLTSLFHRLLSSYDTTATRPPPLVLDIGMNIGWFSLYSRAHGHEVASFEPNPTMFLRMCESLEYNHWREDDGSVSLWNYGLGSMPGVFNLTLGKNPGGSSFHGERLAKKYRWILPVRVATLDSIAMMQGWLDRRISLAKVDVEGFEDQVIEGGKRLIYNGNVENIIMENGNNNVTTVGLMLDTLYDAGYRVREILTVNGDPYHEDWWHTFNPALEERRKAGKAAVMSDQLAFLAKVTCNIWWQHKRIASDDV
ncbi:hypothetical protein ACHAXA_002168 [Cyclostephanos tholiformis]|uniref:Methyltransferase FkbM domain-containing protein n=1 Tax=Cyclostephanos tholiformis TaxID=382380 RepID=A0ABD3RA48_9STRA